jgi:hypothetical protein
MVPERLIYSISDRLTREIGHREDVGVFVFAFAAAPSGHDMEYALDELKKATDPEYKRAIQIFLEEIVK